MALLALLGAIIALSACSPVLRDCIWSGTATAWIDANGNGVRDPGDAPIPGVKFSADDTLNGGHTAATAETNWQGEAGLSVWMPGCPSAHFEVYPEIPPGYRLTTTPRLSASDRETDQVFAFGFTYLAGVPTATPRPPGPRCSAYNIGKNNVYDLTDLAVAPDGSVWAATFGNGVAHIAPERGDWTWYHSADGLADEHVRSITVAPDGTTWFATQNGASHHTGSAWTTYHVQDGLVDENVYKIAVDQADAVWLATEHGASRFDVKANTWTSYTEKDGLPDDFVRYVAVTPDGSVWLPTVVAGVARLMPASEPPSPRWVTYSRHGSQAAVPFDFIHEIAVAPDGSYWFVGSGLMRFDPSSSTWTLYDDLGYNEAVAVAPDGAVWIAGGSDATQLSRLVPDPRGPGHAFLQIFDSRDGLPVSPPRTGARALAVASSTEVWIATTDTVARCIFTNP